jgi:predicted DNA-binding transcriptional regulator YafY
LAGIEGEFEKGDRLLRLLSALRIFQAVPHGLTTAELAERLGVTRRTAQRDIRALEEALHVPFYEEGGRWKVRPEFWLKPIHLSLPEAIGLLLSARLMLRHADKADEFTAAAYEKLAAVLPGAVREAVVDAATRLATKPADATHSRVLATLAQAWAEQKKVRVTYTMTRTFERVLWPLFLEPSPFGHSLYLLAWDEKADAPRAYKIERISAVKMLDEAFEQPQGFRPGDHLASAWGIWGGEGTVDVELLFAASVARRVKETTWHPSQQLAELPDGRVRLKLKVSSWLELRHWVLGWGETCEVIGPPELRQSVRLAVASLARTYGVTSAQQPTRRPAQRATVIRRSPRR